MLQGHAALLAPVDFDLSFRREHFFSPYTGSYDQELFDSWMESEHMELERALAGETANTGMDMITTDAEVWISVVLVNQNQY